VATVRKSRPWSHSTIEYRKTKASFPEDAFATM